MFTQIDDDLNTQKDRTDKHKELLLVYGRQLRDQKVVNQELNSRVVVLEEEARVREVQVNELANSVDELRATINSMMGLLCHCSEGKGKEREVVVKVEEESEELEYASEDEYRTAPGTGEAMVTELIPIDQDPEEGEIPSEVQETCGCGLPDHPIVIEDDNVSVAENAVAIPIRVERPFVEDRVVSRQLVVRSSGPIRSSRPRHIAGVGVRTISGYALAKSIERRRRGEEDVPRDREASLGFGSGESSGSDSSGHLEEPRTSPHRIRPTGYVAGPIDGTDDEVDHYVGRRGRRGNRGLRGGVNFVKVRGGNRAM